MFNKGNMAKMLKQAQEVQKQIENVQNELDDLNIEGESGGGMVKATVNGKMELLDLSLQGDILGEEKDIIEVKIPFIFKLIILISLIITIFLIIFLSNLLDVISLTSIIK